MKTTIDCYGKFILIHLFSIFFKIGTIAKHGLNINITKKIWKIHDFVISPKELVGWT